MNNNNVISMVDPWQTVERTKKDIELLAIILENALDENERLRKLLADKNNKNKQTLISAKEASSMYGLSEYQIRELGKQGIIGEVAIGGSVRFINDDIDNYINSFRKTKAKAI